MNINQAALALFSAVLLNSAPAAALDRGPDWGDIAKEVRGKTAEITARPKAAAAAKSDDWCAREFAKNAANAKEISDLLVSGKIEEKTHGLLIKMNENAFKSVELTCQALAGKGERISKEESDRRWCAGERAKLAESAAEVSALHASGKITPESRDLLNAMNENARQSVDLTCRALGVRP